MQNIALIAIFLHYIAVPSEFRQEQKNPSRQRNILLLQRIFSAFYLITVCLLNHSSDSDSQFPGKGATVSELPPPGPALFSPGPAGPCGLRAALVSAGAGIV